MESFKPVYQQIKVLNLVIHDIMPEGYTGIINWYFTSGRLHYTAYYENCKLHREDGPAVEGLKGTKCWYLEDNLCATRIFKLPKDHILLDVEDHPKYPKVKIWKILEKDRIYEAYIFPGMLSQE